MVLAFGCRGFYGQERDKARAGVNGSRETKSGCTSLPLKPEWLNGGYALARPGHMRYGSLLEQIVVSAVFIDDGFPTMENLMFHDFQALAVEPELHKEEAPGRATVSIAIALLLSMQPLTGYENQNCSAK